eukprot:NODE_8815_length_1468_cov_3.138702.p1 GENE.NODE_8815_length_1468_cov_3.138702~~NODE_8815_length_1468_cov_3.138702.p1  ORF type:complete len:379 (-),score=118.27 NODE_8815_length_1468_cov_3.138702:330-1352(-)
MPPRAKSAKSEPNTAAAVAEPPAELVSPVALPSQRELDTPMGMAAEQNLSDAEDGEKPRPLVAGLSTPLPLTTEDVERIWAFGDDHVRQEAVITEVFGLVEAYPLEPRRLIVRDFLMGCLLHSRAIALAPAQGAAFVAIMLHLLEMCKGPCDEPRHEDCAACFDELKRLLMVNSVEDPPERLFIFRAQHARMLADFASQTFFRHFLLYQYCLNCNQEREVLRFTLPVGKPPPLPDLLVAEFLPGVQPSVPVKAKKAAAELGSGEPGTPSREARNLRAAPQAEDEGAELTEAQRIERLVRGKLAETEAKLEQKLQKRHSDFLAQLEAEKLMERPPTGKKKA